MKQLRYFFAIAASALMMFACQKDVDIDSEFALGGTLKLRLDVPALQTVEITRGAVEETEAYNVKVYIFDKAGNRAVNPVNITLNPTNEDSYSRKYEVDTKITLPAASDYDIYAIANTESNSLWDGVAEFDAATTKAAFEAIALTYNTVENPSKRMTLSGHATFSATGAVDLAVDIKLSRPYAKVTFNVKNGTTNPNFTFTPTSYSIYNVPTKASMFDNTASLTGDFKDYENRAIALGGSFEFLQLENAYSVVEGPAKYTDREKRVSDTDRAFAYAPANSTYVVIYGDGVEKDGQGNIKKISKTNYTIHLGDFSASGDMGDYSVNRNTHYTYNVTVNGVNMVEVEAKRQDGDYENGAEGYVINLQSSPQVYTLDAHYETVLLKLDITNTKFGEGDSELNGLTMSVSTPMMDANDRNVNVGWNEISTAITNETLDAFYKKYDAKWVEFMPVSTADFAAYKSAKMFYVCEFLNEIYKEKTAPDANSTLTVVTENGIDYIYVVAFINEYYYDGESWAKFVNQPDREMKILQSPQVSTDGHSVYSEALCIFSQKSISTMFDPSSTENVFGIEMYDETGLMDINTDNAGSSSTNGRANMLEYITAGTTKWNTIIRNGGYNYEGQPNGNSYKALVNTNDASYACIQRNRDNNGNGTIDSDELRWYMPALDQYNAFWYGEEALPTYARLFQGLTTDVKNGTEYNQLHHYYTSTSGGKRIFWAIEGSSYGSDNQTWQADTHNTRCIRNLKSVEDEPAEATTHNSNIITINNFVETAYRTATQNGQYPEHHERDIANKLPHAFKVASKNLDDRTIATTYVIKAPNVSSAVAKNGKTVLTFASVESGIGYYYTTSNAASQTNKIDIVNNQATIDVVVDASAPMEGPVVEADWTGRNLTMTPAVESGLEYYYTTSTTFAKTNKINGTASISVRSADQSYYVWAYDPTTEANSVYTQVTTTATYNSWFYVDYSATVTYPTLNRTRTIYLWAYDQGLDEYSNATTVTTSGITIGADKEVTKPASDTYTRLAATTQDLCANYNETADPEGAPEWRVPNQREMTAMSLYASELGLEGSYYTSTKFSNAINASSTGTNRYSYLFTGGIMTLQGDNSGLSIRCVRDLAPGEGPAAKTDGDYEEGGDLVIQ
ncbi:MAG: hypothetical protein J6J14_05235 [Rikenellaceae bacterium]|nr:hypothetical protein [Rikenellaceae bacterium]